MTKANVMMVQRNAAGSLRVSLSSLIISPKNGGPRGLKTPPANPGDKMDRAGIT